MRTCRSWSQKSCSLATESPHDSFSLKPNRLQVTAGQLRATMQTQETTINLKASPRRLWYTTSAYICKPNEAPRVQCVGAEEVWYLAATNVQLVSLCVHRPTLVRPHISFEA